MLHVLCSISFYWRSLRVYMAFIQKPPSGGFKIKESIFNQSPLAIAIRQQRRSKGTGCLNSEAGATTTGIAGIGVFKGKTTIIQSLRPIYLHTQ